MESRLGINLQIAHEKKDFGPVHMHKNAVPFVFCYCCKAMYLLSCRKTSLCKIKYRKVGFASFFLLLE